MKKKILLNDIPEEMRKLRSVSSEVVDVGEVSDLITDMWDSMRAVNGIGLSAVQIGVLKRVAVMEYKESRSAVPKTVLINPEIVWVSKKEVLDEEGCLSFPNIYGMVRRPEKIVYRALNEKGQIIESKAGGLLARVIQHEIDHLNGVLFIDKVEGDLYTYEKQDDTEKI